MPPQSIFFRTSQVCASFVTQLPSLDDQLIADRSWSLLNVFSIEALFYTDVCYKYKMTSGVSGVPRRKVTEINNSKMSHWDTEANEHNGMVV